MARLFEYQGKDILRDAGVAVPKSIVAESPDAARKAAEEIGGPVVVKAQAWVTGRAGAGGIKFADTPAEAAAAARQIIGLQLKGFTVEKVLVEEKLDIERECFAGIIVDDSERKPMLIVSSIGGSGIEQIAREHPEAVAHMHIDVGEGLRDHSARNLLRGIGITGKDQLQFGNLLVKLWRAASGAEARSAEVNPIVRTADGRWIAADCHMTIDDYAVFRHPELGIEIAREFDRPATELEKIAYRVEEGDYRGTFYFIQLETEYAKGEGVVGFHGSGGGGSMMSMDALLDQGFKLANFCDTSGNPAASKVYRAARIILNQGPVDGYFLSGSGVASQEQFHSARGLVKAFREEWLSIPAVIRLGGNGEEEAVRIIEEGTRDLPAPVEAYTKHASPDFCAARLKELISNYQWTKTAPKTGRPFSADYEFKSQTGVVQFDDVECRRGGAEIIMAHDKDGVFELVDGVPRLTIAPEEVPKRCKHIENLAIEDECRAAGFDAVRIILPIEGFDAAVNTKE